MSEYIVEVSEWVIDAYGNPPFGKGEEIVRCKDCKHFGFFDDGEEKDYCGYWGSLAIEPDGYCAWGERKNELELIEEGIEYAKATYPNTMRLLEDE